MTKTYRVGVVYWRQGDGISTQTSRIIESLGHEVINFDYNATLPQKLDVVIAFGPFGSLVPLGKQLLACAPSQRPAFVWWLSEQFPNPDWPEWLRYWGGMLRSRVERWAIRQNGAGLWQPKPGFRWLTTKAHRFRYYGDVHWLQGQGVLSVLVLPSFWVADFLRARGFDPFVSPPSYRPGWGADLKINRDIPVLWLGKIATTRRGRLLNRLRQDLRARKIELLVIDGVEHPYVFGDERTMLLNRTKIMVNLLREKWDDNSMRFNLATHNKALVVTEPTLPHTRFLPGEHLAEAPIEHMADTICYYLSQEEERQRIVERAYQLITKYSREEVIAEVLELAVAKRKNTSIDKVARRLLTNEHPAKSKVK